MKNKIVLVLFGATFFVQSAVGSELDTDVSLSEAEKETVKAKVRSSLKDPESARFGQMNAAEGDKGIMVCGYVNAKNSFGGYTGEKPYFGLLLSEEIFFPVAIGGDEQHISATKQMCEEYGIDM